MLLFRLIATAILLTAAIPAQEPGDTTFHAATTTVLVPFNVQRGKYFAADLRASDFILLQDGHPRPFTVFEGPNTQHPLPLELILVFDTSIITKKNSSGGMLRPVWDAKANYEFLDNWDEETTQTILRQSAMDVRLSIYHFDDGHFERLCRGSSDPQEIDEAFRKLLNPIPAADQLALLPGDRVNPRVTLMNLFAPGWWKEASVAAMRDASDSQPAARRIMLVFSEFDGGPLGPWPDWQAVGSEALARGIEIDPVVMGFYKMAPHFNEARDRSSQAWHHDTPKSAQLGEMTGGEVHTPEHLNREAMSIILQRMRNRTLSKYVVGFVPDAATKPGKHNLQVELKPKTVGKIVDGAREDVVY